MEFPCTARIRNPIGKGFQGMRVQVVGVVDRFKELGTLMPGEYYWTIGPYSKVRQWHLASSLEFLE
jgi:hypothetical protein